MLLLLRMVRLGHSRLLPSRHGDLRYRNRMLPLLCGHDCHHRAWWLWCGLLRPESVQQWRQYLLQRWYRVVRIPGLLCRYLQVDCRESGIPNVPANGAWMQGGRWHRADLLDEFGLRLPGGRIHILRVGMLQHLRLANASHDRSHRHRWYNLLPP